MILPNVHFPGVASHLLVSKKLSNFLSLTTVKVLISFIGCVRRNGPYILSPILTYRKFTQGRNFLPFLFSLKFLLLQSTPRQFLLPFVCFSGAIFLPLALVSSSSFGFSTSLFSFSRFSSCLKRFHQQC